MIAESRDRGFQQSKVGAPDASAWTPGVCHRCFRHEWVAKHPRPDLEIRPFLRKDGDEGLRKLWEGRTLLLLVDRSKVGRSPAAVQVGAGFWDSGPVFLS